MHSWAQQFFGLGPDEQRVVDWHLAIRTGGTAAGLIILGLLLTGLTVFLYRRELDGRPKKRWVLTVVRSLLLLGLIGILLEPRIRFTVERKIRQSLLLLVDTSASMSIDDPRREDADLIRAGIALGAVDSAALQQQHADPDLRAKCGRVPRERLVTGALQNTRLDLLRRLSATQDVRPFTFADRLTDVAGGNEWPGKLRADGRGTAGGDALRDLLARTRGQPVSGIFLITDGANNAGSSPAAAAETASRAGVPLFIWGVGLPSPPDIIVSSVYTQDIAFIDDVVSVAVRVRSTGMQGKSADVILKLGDDEVARKAVTFGPDGEQSVQLEFTPKTAGDCTLTASIPPREEEVVKDNNQQSTSIRVVDGKIKVLLVEQRPRWEFKYLQAMLLRDRRVELKCLLQEADAGISESKDSIYLPRLPTNPSELFRYDVIIFGDVDCKDVLRGQLDAVKRYVGELGGGMIFIAGADHDPLSYRNTPLADLLPVELLDALPPAAADHSRPIRVELTAAGRAAHMLRLADTDAESAAIWAGLPPIFFDAPVARPKPAAEVLAVDPDPAKATRSGKMPLIAIQQYGIGQVLSVGTDNVWRWRKNVGDKYYTSFWGQIVQRLALPHLLGASKKTRITLDKKQYAVGDQVTVYAKLFGDAFDPVADAAVSAGYTTAGTAGPRTAVSLHSLPGQPGLYTGEFTALTAGRFEFSIARDTAVVEPFDVVEPKLEMGDTAMNEPLLRQMAAASGGAFLHEEDLTKLPEMVKQKTETARSTHDVPLWSSPIYFLLLIGLATVEWIVRKTCDLK